MVSRVSYYYCFYTIQLTWVVVVWTISLPYLPLDKLRHCLYSLYAIYHSHITMNLVSRNQSLCHHKRGFRLLGQFYIKDFSLSTHYITYWKISKLSLKSALSTIPTSQLDVFIISFSQCKDTNKYFNIQKNSNIFFIFFLLEVYWGIEPYMKI